MGDRGLPTENHRKGSLLKDEKKLQIAKIITFHNGCVYRSVSVFTNI